MCFITLINRWESKIMMLYLKFFPISALTAKTKRLCLNWLQIELPKELNYWLLFVYIVKAKIIFIWWGTNACVCRFACVDLCVWKICKKRSVISILLSVKQSCRARPASRHKNIRIVQQEGASQKIIERWQLPQSGGAVPLDQGVK